MWTLLYSGTEKSFADWGIQNVQRRLASQAQDEVTFTALGAFDAAALFPYGATITIYRNRTKTTAGTFTGGTIWFFGRRIQDSRRASGSAETVQYIFAGPWWYLDELVYQQKWNVYTNAADPAGSLAGGFRSHVMLNQGDNGAVLTTAQQITDAVNYAIIEALAPLQLDSTLPAINVPMDEQREITVAEVIRKQLRWIPDAVTWFDYTVSPPKLYIRRRADLTAASVSVTGPPLESVDITPRSDLQRPAVVLKFEQTNEINGAAWHTITEQKSPANATGKEFGALLLTIQLQGFSVQVVSAPVVTATIDAAHATDATRLAWWKDRLPWLKDTKITSLAIPQATVVRESARPRELTQGQLPPWVGLAAGEETITAKASYTVLDTAGGTPTRVGEELLTFRVMSTDATTGTYQSVSSYVSGETIPAGLADAIFAAINTLQYDGQIILTEDELTGAVGMGNVLNVTGGDAAWATMRALVQQISEEVDTGRTTVTFGPAGHLGVDDLVELLRVNRNRWNYTNPSSRTSGQGSSGQVALGKQTSKENSSSGVENLKRLVIWDGSVKIDIDATSGAKRIKISGAVGEGSVDIQLTASGAIGTAGRDLFVRELDVCEDGVAKKVRAIASLAYLP